MNDEERAAARQRRVEAALLAGASWPLALEAASTVGIDRDTRDQTYTLDADEVLALSRQHETEESRQSPAHYPGK